MATPIAHKGAVAGAKVQAATLLDLFLDPKIIADAKDYFSNVQLKETTYTPFIAPTDKPASSKTIFRTRLNPFECRPLDATPIFATPHAARSDPRAPFGGLQCEACHGPGGEHVQAQQRGQPGLPPVVFGRNSETPAAEQNSVCLDCHQTHGRRALDGRRHPGVPSRMGP